MGQSTTEELLLIGSILVYALCSCTSDVSGTLWHVGTSLITVKILIYGRTGKKGSNGFTQSECFTVGKICFQGAADRRLPDSNYKFV